MEVRKTVTGSKRRRHPISSPDAPRSTRRSFKDGEADRTPQSSVSLCDRARACPGTTISSLRRWCRGSASFLGLREGHLDDDGFALLAASASSGVTPWPGCRFRARPRRPRTAPSQAVEGDQHIHGRAVRSWPIYEETAPWTGQGDALPGADWEIKVGADLLAFVLKAAADRSDPSTMPTPRCADKRQASNPNVQRKEGTK